MRLNTKLLLHILVVLNTLGCHKEMTDVEKPYSNPGYTHCGEILDDWKISTLKFPDNVFSPSDIFFVTENTGWTVGALGSITKTIDGGINWKIINNWDNQILLTKLNLQCIDFISETIGFIGGKERTQGNEPEVNKGAVFLKSKDGGLSWTKKYFVNYNEFFDIKFYDAFNGIALINMKNQDGTSNKKMMKTKDGGDTWTPIVAPFKNIISDKFIETTKCIYLKYYDDSGKFYLLSSDDRGNSWSIKNPPREIERIDFVSDNIGYATTGNHFYPEIKFKTSDGGQSWEVIETPYNRESLMHFKNLKEGFIINPTYYFVKSEWESYDQIRSYEIFQTKDGGKNWNKKETYIECNYLGDYYSFGGDLFYSLNGKINKFEAK